LRDARPDMTVSAVEGTAFDQAKPLYRELFWPTLHAVQVLGGSATRQEVLDKTVEIGGYGEAEQAALMPNGASTRLNFYTGWSLTRLKRVGLLDNSRRGVWTLTERGQQVVEADIPKLWDEMLAAYRKHNAERRQRSADRPADEHDIEDDAETNENVWKTVLIGRMKAMEPAAFERLCQRLLREADFEKVVVTGRSGDGGIDGVGLVRLGLLSFQTYFQCKRYSGAVGSSAVRDFRGAMAGRGEKGVVITTGTFTRDAQVEATRDGVPPIDLIDGDALCDLLKEHGVGVRVSTRTVEDVIVDAAFWNEHS
jgi:restriction system protein